MILIWQFEKFHYDCHITCTSFVLQRYTTTPPIAVTFGLPIITSRQHFAWLSEKTKYTNVHCYQTLNLEVCYKWNCYLNHDRSMEYYWVYSCLPNGHLLMMMSPWQAVMMMKVVAKLNHYSYPLPACHGIITFFSQRVSIFLTQTHWVTIRVPDRIFTFVTMAISSFFTISLNREFTTSLTTAVSQTREKETYNCSRNH